MSFKTKLIGIACAVAFVAPVHATTYTGFESFDGATVSLSITTDGVIGVVATSDITSWNINITDPAGSFNLTPLNSQEIVSPSGDLTASATALTFNFSGPFGTQLVFENPTIGANGPFYCATSSADCFPGQLTNGAIGVSTQSPESPVEQIALSNTSFVIGTAVGVSGPVFGAGLPGLVFASGGFLVWWRNKRRAQAAT